jgi:non-ribosomal peptide synthetase component F
MPRDGQVGFTIPYCSEETKISTSILQLAWALVISGYTDSTDVVFGTSVSTFAQPHSSISALHMSIRPEQRIDDALKSLKTRDLTNSESDRVLSNRLSNVLRIAHDGLSIENDTSVGLNGEEFRCYSLSITGIIQSQELLLSADFDPQTMSPATMKIVLDQLGHVVRGIQSHPAADIKSHFGISYTGLEQVLKWNSLVQLQEVEQCVHDVITKRCQANPFAQAVCAWDGTLTYAELDSLSTLLAVRLGVITQGTESFIGLLFEKFMWTAVSMIAIMKSGNAFFLLDPTLPDQRLQALCRISEAAAVLTSPAQSHRASCLDPPFAIAPNECKRPIPRFASLPIVTPDHTLYLAFTSGFSGEPKGIDIQHRTTCRAECSDLRPTSSSSVFWITWVP